jgi:hypothetical protein
MARMMFGGGPEDVYLVPDDEGDLKQAGGVVIRFYSTETGNSPIVDLLDINQSPITYVTTSTGGSRVAGQIAPFYGPNGFYEMWAGADGQPRFLLQASNLGSEIGPVKDQFQQHVAQANGHGTRLQDLTNVSPTTPSDGQVPVYNAVSGLYVPGTVAGGGGGTPTNMVTTDTTQTVTAAKTLSGALTTTGGVTSRPSAVGNQARILQALASQTGNVEEWRDSGGTARAWMASDFRLRAPNLGRTVSFARAGAVAVGVGTYRWFNDTGVTLTILSVRIGVGTASSSGTPTVDVNKNGTTIYGTQGNRPTVAVGANVSGKNTGFSVTTVADGEYLSADIDVAGTSASDLWVQIEVA